MKTFFLALIFLLAAQLIPAQSMILKMYTDPAEPTNKDTVLLIAEYQFPSSPCTLDSKGATPIDFEIQAFSHYCLGPLTALCNAIDTFKLDPMEEGEHSFILSLSSGMGEVPCSPGIVIDDLDTLKFTVSLISQTEDPEQGNFYLFPNPVTEVLGFSIPLDKEALVITTAGQMLMTVAPGSVSVDVSDLPSGLYLLKTNGQAYRWIKY